MYKGMIVSYTLETRLPTCSTDVDYRHQSVLLKAANKSAIVDYDIAL